MFLFVFIFNIIYAATLNIPVCVYWPVEKDSTGAKVVVLYPEHGVTKLQKLQLLNVQSDNVSVVGEFCLSYIMVKGVYVHWTRFTWRSLKKKLEVRISSSCSCSFSFYRAMHFSAYARSWDHMSSVCPSVCDVGGLWSHELEILETNCTDN